MIDTSIGLDLLSPARRPELIRINAQLARERGLRHRVLRELHADRLDLDGDDPCDRRRVGRDPRQFALRRDHALRRRECGVRLPRLRAGRFRGQVERTRSRTASGEPGHLPELRPRRRPRRVVDEQAARTVARRDRRRRLRDQPVPRRAPTARVRGASQSLHRRLPRRHAGARPRLQRGGLRRGARCRRRSRLERKSRDEGGCCSSPLHPASSVRDRPPPGVLGERSWCRSSPTASTQ